MQSWNNYPPRPVPNTKLSYLAFVCDELEGSTVTNDPADRGGLTKWGITLRTVQDLIARGKVAPSWQLRTSEQIVRELTKDEAIWVYGQVYYEPYKDLPERVAILLCDIAINSGAKLATLMAQRAYNGIMKAKLLEEDGIWGPKTNQCLLDRLINYPASMEGREIAIDIFADVVCDLRILHYVDICKADPSQLKYLSGWLLRAMRFRA